MYYTISRDRWARVEGAHDAARRVSERLRRLGVARGGRVRAGVGTRVNGQHRERTVTVQIREGVSESVSAITTFSTALDEQLPARIDGTAGSGEFARTVEDLPVVYETVKHRPQSCNHYDDWYRPVPGGAHVEEGGCATACTPAWHGTLGQYVLVTAGHVFDPVDSGVPLYQPRDSWFEDNRIGDSYDAAYDDGNVYVNTGFDAATVDMEVGVAYDFASDYGGYWDGVYGISGVVPWDEIKDNETNQNYKLGQQGATTGRSYGTIDFVSQEFDVFEIKVDSGDGDSGGPYFKERSDGYADIAAVHSYGEGDEAGGTAIVEVEDRFGITV